MTGVEIYAKYGPGAVLLIRGDYGHYEFILGNEINSCAWRKVTEEHWTSSNMTGWGDYTVIDEAVDSGIGVTPPPRPTYCICGSAAVGRHDEHADFCKGGAL